MLPCCCCAVEEDCRPDEPVKAVPILGAVTEVKGFVTLSQERRTDHAAPALSVAEDVHHAIEGSPGLHVRQEEEAPSWASGECGENLVLETEDSDETHLMPRSRDMPSKEEQRSRLAGSRISMPDFAASSTAASSRSSQAAVGENTDEFVASFGILPGQRMGADVAHGLGKAEGTVRIKSINHEGLFAEWNKKSPPEKQICENYFITELNGRKVFEITAEEFRTVIQQAKFVMMTIKKTPPELPLF
mmetsp:Transcript_57424/g.136496  ORF Transcript_57424/g.136496 Transcript_57424/m.136496 type:complete len:246 (+) Transcript_57424:83-820(+)